MAKEMLINVSEGEECRIALVEDGTLEELYIERTSSTSHVNNIYKGRVMNVEPSIQAAFIDFGLGRNGFLHISDLMPTYFGRAGEDIQESVGRKMARRDRPPIQRCLRRGDELLVQVIKEGIGTKGPTLSSYISIPGKILVMMPGMASKGVSRKIEDEDERRRLRKILDELDPPEDVGFIIRTAGVGQTKAEIERDLKYLVRLWETIDKKRKGTNGPVELYTEGDLVTRTVRDLFTNDVDRVVIDNEDVAHRVADVIRLSNPRAKDRVEFYSEQIPLFHKYGIETEVERMYSRHVPLPSGGSLVIDSTEAIVAIDVNSGKFRDHSDAETTAFKTDMEAADEICRQLKLRDLGGVIICDFIDLRYERHRRQLEERIEENLKQDRAKTKVLNMSQFGIIEMTRQRMRPSLKRSVYFDCPHCKGAGLVKTPESMSLDVMRRLAIATNDLKVVRVELSANPDVAFYLLNKKRGALADLEAHNNKRILIRSDPSLGLDEMKFNLYDNRDGLVTIPDLLPESIPHTTQLNTRQPQLALAAPPRGAGAAGGRSGGGRQQDSRRGGGGGRGGQQQRPPHPRHQQRGDEDEQESGRDWERGSDEIEDRTDTMEREAEETGAPSPDVSAARPPRRPEPANRGGGARDDRGSGRDDRNAGRNDRGGARDGRGGGRDNRGPARDDRGAGRDDRGPARNDRAAARDNRAPVPDDRAPVRDDEQDDVYDRDEVEPQGDLGGAGVGNGAPSVDNNGATDEEQQEGGGRRRRRRRRRRGRGRGGNGQGEFQQDGQPAAAGASAGSGGHDAGDLDERSAAERHDEDFDERVESVGVAQAAYANADDHRDDRNARDEHDESRDEHPSRDERDDRSELAAGERGSSDEADTRDGSRPPRGGDRDMRNRGGRRDVAEGRRRGAQPEPQHAAEEADLYARDEVTAAASSGDDERSASGADRDADEAREAFDDRAPVEAEGRDRSDAPEVAAEAHADAEDADAAEAEAPAPKGGRRRGSRGGRGRGRKAAAAEPAATELAEAAEPAPAKPAGRGSRSKGAKAQAATAAADEKVEAEPKAKPKRGTRSRGGTGNTGGAAPAPRGRGRKAAASPAGESVNADASSTDAAASSSGQPQAAAPAPIARTGSTDRHLVDDEPVDPEPVRRPRSYRDLDQIPDDFD